MESYSALGRITNGKLKVVGQAEFSAAMAEFEDGEVAVSVTVSSQAALRSLKALRYYRGVVLPTIKEWGGDSIEYLHHFFKQKFLSVTESNVNSKTGEVTEYTVIGSTSKISATRFTEFVDTVVQFAEEFFQKTMPPPDPDYRRKRHLEAQQRSLAAAAPKALLPAPVTHWNHYDTPRDRHGRMQAACGEYFDAKYRTGEPTCPTCKTAIDTYNNLAMEDERDPNERHTPQPTHPDWGVDPTGGAPRGSRPDPERVSGHIIHRRPGRWR